MDSHDWSVILYAVNFALLMTHQIDSAYWKEWELFRIPGGIQLNLLMNLALLLAGLAGFALMVDDRAAGYVFALVLAGTGVFAFGIHAFFLLRGDERFRLPASVGILATALLISPAQAALAAAELA
jgi:hypothetical protein